jgi:50S ribosomal protein L16 3-hydroxylase
MLEQVNDALSRIRFERDDTDLFLGEYLSTPKAETFFKPPQKALNAARFAATALRHGLRLSPKTRMLYAGRRVFINGESFDTSPADRKTLRLLADQRMLQGEEFGAASADVAEALHAWYGHGWLLLGAQRDGKGL